MVPTRKKRLSNRKLLSPLGDFDQDTASDKQENTIVNEGSGDQDFAVGTSDNNLMTDENGECESLGQMF